MTKMEYFNVVGNEISPMQKCLSLFSQLSDDELKILPQKIEEEKRTRIKEKEEKKEAIQATIKALTKLYDYYEYITVGEEEYYINDIIEGLENIL